ncbi:hypothetical protein E1B28_013148 [Marasmius oreades]|uniref:Wax synthase domain-containing protein n=1 Tax=Marasmius oreades TaxID=181124 RepID=A0A9P7UMC9_9AGAR|nr:uncharacterized protein E1B28_013148 [Marasmius oreades]KAG7087168.1 hypothetical protein E1B28_013148 [Marasmius oreades]
MGSYWQTIASSPVPSSVLAILLLTAVLTVKNATYLQRFLLFTLISLLIAHTITSTTSAGAVFVDWTIGHMLIHMLLMASDFLVLSQDPHAEFLPVRENESQRSKWGDRSLWSRLKWALSLMLNTRCIGWTHEPRKGILPAPRVFRPRRQRILLTSLQVLQFFVLMLLNDVLIKLNPAFRFGSPGVSSSGMSWHLLACLSGGLIVYAPFSIGHAIWELICVGIFGMDKPGEWCPLFGDIGEAWTVTRFWGVTWHQTMRRSFGSHARFLAHRMMRLRQGSFMNRLIQTLVAFFLSGVMHQTGEYMVAREHGHGWWNEGGGSFRFFMLQPLAIVLEHCLLGGKVSKPSIGWRIFGYLWVLLWFSLTVPVWLNGAVRVGLMDQRVGLVFPRSFNVLPGGWDQYR